MLTREDIREWLHETHPRRLEELWESADRVRRENVGDEVHLRGLLEISNFCCRDCTYCGIRGTRLDLVRYRMTPKEILDCAATAADFGYGTVVLQAGEDPALSGPVMSHVVSEIKARHPLAVTLSMGERSDEDLYLWREAGADRYLLRFETSNRELFARIHPNFPGAGRDRIGMLRRLREMGYEIGSGVMIGIPGQTYDDLVNDLLLFAELDLDMIGVGPYIPHPETALARVSLDEAIPPDRGVPNTELMTYKVVALARLLCPQANIPSTTALATLNLAEGREFGLQRGANVLMPNMTPPEYRRLYEIYPSKACVLETAEKCHGCMLGRIRRIGRLPGHGPGGRCHGPIHAGESPSR